MHKLSKLVCLGTLTTALALGVMGAPVAFAAEAQLGAGENNELPAALDLRHYGGTVSYDKSTDKQSVITGGINYVTPVKSQNPFGSCWAFSIIAASETSMLTSLDKADDGKMNGSVDYEKAASGAAGSLAYAASDLSERHLAYCAFSHPKNTGIYSSQAGEGNYLMSGSTSAADIIDLGGELLTGISAFSCGIGPVPESYAPYISDEGFIEVKVPEYDDEGYLKTRLFTSYDKAKEYLESAWTTENVKALLESEGKDPTDKLIQSTIKENANLETSMKGTWSVDASKTYGVLAELCSSNILETTVDNGLDADEAEAMKEEISQGRPVSIAFRADRAEPGYIYARNTYINTKTWAHYTFENAEASHAVTVVGYDDNYDKSNFTHKIYKTTEAGKILRDENGKAVVDEEATARTTPEHNGAWIVKNFWGYSDASSLLNKSEWGIDGSGYFYLSYEDKTVCRMESYEFDLSTEAQAKESYATDQYDISKAFSNKSIAYDSEHKTCNVFTNEDGAATLRDIGCMTGAADDTVKIQIYLMNEGDDAATVIAEGEPAARQTETFQHAGFHRFTLDEPLIVANGQKVAVVQTTKQQDGRYECTFPCGNDERFAQLASLSFYNMAVVNEGESLLYADGEWSDWADNIEALSAQCLDAEIVSRICGVQVSQEEADQLVAGGARCTIDNFSIKLYLDPVVKAANTLRLAKNSWIVKGKKGGSTKIKVKKACGKVAFKSSNKKVRVTAKGKVTVGKGTAAGVYKVRVTAAGDTTHKVGTKIFTVKVR